MKIGPISFPKLPMRYSGRMLRITGISVTRHRGGGIVV
jgi:hypothetical protein